VAQEWTDTGYSQHRSIVKLRTILPTCGLCGGLPSI